MPSRADSFEQQLSLINQGLKAQRAGVSINRRGQGLALLSTLPSKTPGKPPQQQRVPLSLNSEPALPSLAFSCGSTPKQFLG